MSSRSQHLSGCPKRKLRAQREDATKKMSRLLGRFIKPIVLAEATQYYSNVNNNNGINEVDQVSVDNSFDNVLSSSVSAENTSPVHFIYSKLTPEEINLIIQLGPCQPCPDDLSQKHFPFDKTSRHGHFNEQWYS
ncbi:hypothetical protein QTP88_013205 [Uroleucon formosanum]